MAKRNAENQITKETYDEDDYDRHGPPDPSVMATKEVMAGRKIAKPRSRVGLKPGSLNSPADSPAAKPFQATPQPAPPQTGLFGSAFSKVDDSTPKTNPLGAIPSSAQFSSTPSSNPFGSLAKPASTIISSSFGSAASASQSEGFSFRSTTSATPKTGFQTTPGNLFGSPAKQPVFSSIPTFMSDDRETDSNEPSTKRQKPVESSAPALTPQKSLFETSNTSFGGFKSTPTVSGPLASSNGAATNPFQKPSQAFGGASLALTKPTPSMSLDVTTANIHDPKSLDPPSKTSIAKSQMPEFNFLFQVKSLNRAFVQKVNDLLESDSTSDLSQLVELYKNKMSEYDATLSQQKEQVRRGMNINKDNVPASKTPSETFSAQPQTFASPYPKLPEPKEAETAKPSNAPIFAFGLSSTSSVNFGGSTPAFGSNTQQKENKTESNAPSNPFEAKPQPSAPSLFSAAPKKQEGSVFGSSQKPSLLKPAASASIFNFNSNASSATPSGAASPGGSVLDGGTAGMTSGNDGGWVNPFAKLTNPMFVDDTSDKSENDEDEDEDQGENGNSEPVAQTDIGQDLRSQAGAGFKDESSAKKDNQSTTTPMKPSNAGLFSSTTKDTPPAKDFRWTPDKPISFGQTSSTPLAKADNAPAGTAGNFTGLFGGAAAAKFGAPQNTTSSPSLFGSNTATTSAASSGPAPSIFGNLGGSKPPASGSIFNFGAAASKPVDAKPLFGAGLSKGSSIFGSVNSPAPSGLSTPGESSEKNASGNEGGNEDSNEPSDEAGQGPNSNSVDLSGAGAGEEDEDTTFDIRSSIYTLENKTYTKVGVGRLRVLHNRLNGKGRVVAKTESGKLIMNVALRKEVSYKSGPGDADKVVKILEVVQGKQAPKVWVMKVGKAEDATTLRQKMDESK